MAKVKKIISKEDRDLYFRSLAQPSVYATFRLGMTPHIIHRNILDTLFAKKGSKVIFRAANGVGKTSTVLTAAILYALEHLDAQVISTAAVYRQIGQQLIPNLKSFSHLFPRTWKFMDSGISINGMDMYVGFSSDDESQAQGWHEKPNQPLLICVDEAAGVSDSIFRAFDRCQPTYMLICGSPLDPEGFFYQAETEEKKYKFYHHFKMTQFDCLKSKGYWIKDELVSENIEKWGEGHPWVLSSIYAEFCNQNENQIISLSQLLGCLRNPPEQEYGKRQVGIDVAAGTAENVIALRHGNKISLVHCWREKDTMAAVGKIKIELDKLKRLIGLQASEVYIDSDGMGIVVHDRLHELGWKINAFHGNFTPSDENHYTNIIAEAWIEGCRKIALKEIIIPDDKELHGQLLGRQQKLNSSGKMQLENKKDLQARGVISPDRADAVMIALSDALTSGLVTTVIPVGNTDYYEHSVGF